jgi:starch synthase (maltosyl-transferring)
MGKKIQSRIDVDGRCRAVIAAVTPEVEGGRFPCKRTVGESVIVEADLFADGHDSLSGALLYRQESASDWIEAPMEPMQGDRWRGRFKVERLGVYHYTVLAWVDHFKTWRRDLAKKIEAGQDVTIDLVMGAQWVEAAAARAAGGASGPLQGWAGDLAGRGETALERRVELALSPELAEVMARHPDRAWATRYDRELMVVVDPVLARFGAWYELFPRSLGKEGRHGTFRDVESHLPRVAEMGFDVLYLPPIHPIGRSFRKGKNNQPLSEPGEPGSPWAIGAVEGGHKSIHPELGTLEDFRRLVASARGRKIEIALDIAFQCSPDHPYVTEHPEWFRKRPDGSIQYAENPPKKYQDIYPFDFESAAWEGMWRELKSIFEYWVEQGVTVFRVDNPHTKALPFWEWCITELKGEHPELIFLSEAFTRPSMLHRLAGLGFTQSYNYFPWRNTKQELTEYLTALTQSASREYLRPNLWPNTPDILPQYLQYGGRPAFMVRLVLAATLGASYGIYGPAFELCVNEAREPGSEEYLNSEKYEIKAWDLDAPGHLGELIQRVNRIRRENPALQSDHELSFHAVDNEQLLAYSKTTEDRQQIILVLVNLDPHHIQRGWLELPLAEFDIPEKGCYQMHDLLTGARYLWHGSRNFVELDPKFVPAHIFRLRRRVRTERDFDYYL